MQSVYTATMTPAEFIETAVRVSEEYILELVSMGTIPNTVANFSELHDFIDANELGGFCDADLQDTFLAIFPKHSDADEALVSDAFLDACNTIQNTVNQWIVEGGINATYE